MRAIVLSDTHGNKNRLLNILTDAGDFDVLIHLGDGTGDLDAVRPFVNADIIAVKGNNDIFTGLPESRIIELCGLRIYCCHGHTADVRSSRARLAHIAKEAGCDIALYGHTHIAADETINGVRCINPGSVGYPVGKRMYIEISDDGGCAGIRFVEAE